MTVGATSSTEAPPRIAAPGTTPTPDRSKIPSRRWPPHGVDGSRWDSNIGPPDTPVAMYRGSSSAMRSGNEAANGPRYTSGRWTRTTTAAPSSARIPGGPARGVQHLLGPSGASEPWGHRPRLVRGDADHVRSPLNTGKARWRRSGPSRRGGADRPASSIARTTFTRSSGPGPEPWSETSTTVAPGSSAARPEERVDRGARAEHSASIGSLGSGSAGHPVPDVVAEPVGGHEHREEQVPGLARQVFREGARVLLGDRPEPPTTSRGSSWRASPPRRTDSGSNRHAAGSRRRRPEDGRSRRPRAAGTCRRRACR